MRVVQFLCVDEAMAFYERKIIRAQKNSYLQTVKIDSLDEMTEKIFTNQIVQLNEVELAFDTKNYFFCEIPLITIKDFYLDWRAEETQLWIIQSDAHISQRFWCSSIEKEISMYQWAESIQRKCCAKQWKVVIERVENSNQLNYLCYKLDAGQAKFFNIAFQFRYKQVLLKGVFNCPYGNKKTYGVLLEAMLLANYKKILEEK